MIEVCTKQNPNKSLLAEHPDKEYLYTYDDWFDGDSDDVYKCPHCDSIIRIYIPR